jgi:hypothetical protein
MSQQSDLDSNATSEKLTTEQVAFFETKIRPVLIEHCYKCHSADGQSIRGGLGVDSRDALYSGGESGPAVVPGKPEESILWNAMNYQDYRMPPNGKLPDSILNDFKTWIEMGAPDPRINEGVVVHSKVTHEDIQKGRSHWAFQPHDRYPNCSRLGIPRSTTQCRSGLKRDRKTFVL